MRYADVTAALGEALADSGPACGLDSPSSLTSKRRRFDTAAPPPAPGNLSGSLSLSHGSLGSFPFLQADTPQNAYANLVAPGGPFNAGAGMLQPFATSPADAAEVMATGVLSRQGSLQQRTRSLPLTKERMELMRVRCGVNGTHPMRAAVKAAYRTIVARYAAPGRLPMQEITRVLARVLEKEEIVLRSMWEAHVERQGEALSTDAGTACDSGAADALFWKLSGSTATPSGMGVGLNRQGDRGLRLSEGTSSWGPGGDEHTFYASSSEYMIAMLVSARSEMMRLVQELPLKVRGVMREMLTPC